MLGYPRTPPPLGPQRLIGRLTYHPPPPPFQTPKSFRTRLGVKIRPGRPPRVAVCVLSRAYTVSASTGLNLFSVALCWQMCPKAAVHRLLGGMLWSL